nr:GrpB family protein [Alicyclobacillus ferrooxydans]
MVRSEHVHVYQEGSPEIERHLAFRDYLRTHVDAVKAYGGLKRRLAERFPYDVESYIAGKDGLVKDIEQRALIWYQDQHRT